jgi:hypothetical protein
MSALSPQDQVGCSRRDGWVALFASPGALGSGELAIFLLPINQSRPTVSAGGRLTFRIATSARERFIQALHLGGRPFG